MKRINGTAERGSRPIGCFVLVKEPSRIELIMKWIELLFGGWEFLRIEFRGSVYAEDRKPLRRLGASAFAAFFGVYRMKLSLTRYLENQGLLYKYFSHDTRIFADGVLYGDYFRSRQKSRILYYSAEERDLFEKVLLKLSDQGIVGEFVEYKGLGRA